MVDYGEILSYFLGLGKGIGCLRDLFYIIFGFSVFETEKAQDSLFFQTE